MVLFKVIHIKYFNIIGSDKCNKLNFLNNNFCKVTVFYIREKNVIKSYKVIHTSFDSSDGHAK